LKTRNDLLYWPETFRCASQVTTILRHQKLDKIIRYPGRGLRTVYVEKAKTPNCRARLDRGLGRHLELSRDSIEPSVRFTDLARDVVLYVFPRSIIS